ncbi:MAG: glycosyltransferase family 2 protein, partial [Planctomycetaceae bacterium]|nr:glycosyltransferase family 2 protein [Planctomycetaceae bacterium]
MSTVTLIIPTLNEEQNIQPLLTRIEKIRSVDYALQVLFVDDASTDGTVNAIKSWRDPSWVNVLERTGKPDLTQSVLDGVSQTDSDFILVMDADLSHPIEKIPELLQPLISGTHDLTVGSRYVKGGGSDDWPLHRRLLSWGGGVIGRVLCDVKDTTSGFFACRRECFDRLDSGAAGYKILMEILVSGIDQLRVKEVPIRFTDRIHGESKLSSKQMIEYLRRIVALSGGAASITTASRFAAVGATGVGVDFAVFLSLIHWFHLPAGSAHVFSFLVALVSNYTLNSIWSFRYEHDQWQSWLVRGSKYALTASLALTLRGGVLTVFIDLFHWSPTLAIFPAILAA